MNDYTTEDFMLGMDVREWFDDYAVILLSKFFPVESGFGELA